MASRKRRLWAAVIVSIALLASAVVSTLQLPAPAPQSPTPQTQGSQLASETLAALSIKGRASRTGYNREQFSDGWAKVGTCDIRNLILQRDLTDVTLAEDKCSVLRGSLHDPYTDKTILFTRGQTTSDDVQIDHVVAVSDAWQKGAQQLSADQRRAFYNDPLNLLAVDGPTNTKKGDGDAATWLPPHKPYRCQYVARQIAVKSKYTLWVTQAEHDAIKRILDTCPDQKLPIVAG